MDIKFNQVLRDNSEVLLRRCGYAKQEDHNTGKISYFKRLTTQHFPKFHVYVENDSPLFLTLHLDQKPHAYTGQRAHGGEYDGPLVEREAARIKSSILSTAAASRPATIEDDLQEDKGWFGKFFGH